MSRIIDADALKDRLQEALEFQEKHDNYEGAELFEIAQDFVDEQPTIDAIPVEWLEQKRKCSDPESVRDINGAFVTICIDGVLVLWQKEQEAR